MSKLTAKHLVSAGIEHLYFTNRSIEHARELARLFGGTAICLDSRAAVISLCDLVVSSTGAPHYIIKTDEIRGVMKRRKGRPLFLIDIAAPGDIEPSAGSVENVFLYNIDHIETAVRKNSLERVREIAAAEMIIREETLKYCSWYHSRKVLPALVGLRGHFMSVCERELRKYQPEIDSLSPLSREMIRRFAESLVNKLLHSPSTVLKKAASGEDGDAMADAVINLFELERHGDE